MTKLILKTNKLITNKQHFKNNSNTLYLNILEVKKLQSQSCSHQQPIGSGFSDGGRGWHTWHTCSMMVRDGGMQRLKELVGDEQKKDLTVMQAEMLWLQGMLHMGKRKGEREREKSGMRESIAELGYVSQKEVIGMVYIPMIYYYIIRLHVKNYKLYK